MNPILTSKMFLGSSHKDKILSALADPINKPLVEQLKSYAVIDPDNVVRKESDTSKHEDSSLSSKSSDNNNSRNSSHSEQESDNSANSISREEHSRNSFKHTPQDAHEPLKDDKLKEDRLDEDNIGESEHEAGDSHTSSGESEDVDNENSNTSDNNKVESSVNVSSSITIEQAMRDATKIMSALNLDEETKGVDHFEHLYTPSGSEIWIYYDKKVDISPVLDKIVNYLQSAGYYYLEFVRIDRDKNAVVFKINWSSIR